MTSRPLDDAIAAVLRPWARYADVFPESTPDTDSAVVTIGNLRSIRSLLQRLEAVAPPTSGDDSGRVEGWIGLKGAQWRKVLVELKAAHDRGFLSGRRSGLEEAAKVEPIPPPDFKYWMTACRNTFQEGVNSFRIAIRALLPEAKP